MNRKPALLFYCQHSLGMGHLVRSFSLASALAEHFQVVFLNGGPVPENLPVPKNIILVNLPPLGMGADSQLLSREKRYTVEAAKADRHQQIQQLYSRYQPASILIELFPFGRKKFACELLPLLERAQAEPDRRPAVFCSVRDILVGSRRDQQRHDDRAASCINRYFDAVLVHSDPRFAHIDESFHPTLPLEVEMIHTGFVSPDTGASLQAIERREGILVSAGGGIVGMPLFEAAIEAQTELWKQAKLPMTLVTGPFLPDQDWRALQHRVKNTAGITLLRSVPNLRKLMKSHSLSISQCGYNTMMDLLATQPAALVVPFSTEQEDEQMNRAQRLQRLGMVQCIAPSELSGAALLASLASLRKQPSLPVTLNTAGAVNTASIISGWESTSSYNRSSRVIEGRSR